MVPTTDYVNTISTGDEPDFPGNEELERRYRRWIRWNAAVTVHRAQRPGIGVGGHISTYASAAALYEVGHNHFFRGLDDKVGGDQIFYQGHASPGMYARSFLEGRLTEQQLDGFRQEKSAAPHGLPSYPHPRMMERLLAVPHRVDGSRADQCDLPGDDQQVPRGARHQAGRRLARLGVPRRWRDGRGRVARAAPGRRQRGARQPHLRDQLQPAAPRRAGPRQRQDHPGARELLPRSGLERHQGDLGPRLGRAPRPRLRRRACSTS